MTEALPTGEYEWMTAEELTNINFENLDLEGENGMVLECEEITYPEELHEKHQEFPLIAAKREIVYNDLSCFPKFHHCSPPCFPLWFFCQFCNVSLCFYFLHYAVISSLIP